MDSGGSWLANTSSLETDTALVVHGACLSDEGQLIAELLLEARKSMRHPDAALRIEGLEMVATCGTAVAEIDQGIFKELADMHANDSDPDVRRAALQTLDALQLELSLQNELETNAPKLEGDIDADDLAAILGIEQPVNYDWLVRAGCANRKLASPPAMEALAAILFDNESERPTTAGSQLSVGCQQAIEDLERSGIAKEVLPLLADAARASPEESVRQAATTALMHFGRTETDADKARKTMQFTITLVKKRKEGLGLRVDRADTQAMLIGEVKEGPVKEWNNANPYQCVRAGDRIIDINGVSGDMKTMAVEARAKAELIMVIEPECKVTETDEVVLRKSALNGLNSALKARSQKLLYELDDLFDKS